MGTDVAVPGALPEGLEDYDPSTDAQMPRVRIDHDEAQFVDTLSNKYLGESIDTILLGLVKQRVLWEADVRDDAKPLCKSYNFLEGHPDPDSWPVKMQSVFTRDQIESGETLACADCPFKEWGSHPKRNAPWCTEQHTFALMLPIVQGDETVGWSPALLSLQRSAIKASRGYITGFVKEQQPLFTQHTRLTLERKKQGNVNFAVPKLIRMGETDSDDFPNFSETLRGIRDFLQTPRTRDDEESEDDAADTGNVAHAPESQKAAAKKAPAANKAAKAKATAKSSEDEPTVEDEPDGEPQVAAEEELPF